MEFLKFIFGMVVFIGVMAFNYKYVLNNHKLWIKLEAIKPKWVFKVIGSVIVVAYWMVEVFFAPFGEDFKPLIWILLWR